MKNYFLLIPVLSILFLQCTELGNSKKETKNVESVRQELTPDMEIAFPIDSLVSPNSDAVYSHINQKNREQLYYLNRSNNTILVFDLNGKRLICKIGLKYDGPDGVGEILGFKVISEDSILVTPLSGGRVYLINDKGLVKNRYDYNDHPNFSGTFKARSNTPMVIVENKMYILQFPPSPYSNISKEKFGSASLGMTVDLVTGKVNTLNVKYPASYWSEGYFPPYLSRQSDVDKLVYAFRYSENLYFHKMGESSLSSISIGSEVGSFDKYSVKSIEESQVRAVREPWIANFLYDQFNEVFYLVYYLGDENLNQTHNRSKSYLSKFKIVILNKALQVTGSHIVTPETYVIDNMFVGKNGLYISTNNELNENMNEDTLSYQLFRLVSK